MSRPRQNFPYWDLAREIEQAEGISLAEAFQRVVESAVEDATDNLLGQMEIPRRSLRSTKMKLAELREQYYEHHPRAAEEPQSPPHNASAESLIDEAAGLVNGAVNWRKNDGTD